MEIKIKYMKKLILLLILTSVLYTTKGQMKWTEDKINHACIGTMIGWTSNTLVWGATDRKLISFISGVGMSYLAGHLKEDFDMRHGGFYNNQDIRATVIGGVIGSGIISIIMLPSVPKRKLPLEYHYLLDDENTMIRK
jgi:hypothetical protein